MGDFSCANNEGYQNEKSATQVLLLTTVNLSSLLMVVMAKIIHFPRWLVVLDASNLSSEIRESFNPNYANGFFEH